jgi:REP element-mobilizing transposase RayT
MRLPTFDYRASGPYFVTICTHTRACLFGSVMDGSMRLNRLGDIVRACWAELPAHNRGLHLDEFVVMPNHVHGLVLLNQDDGAMHALPQVINGFKTAAARRINEVRGTVGAPVWQRSYYERIVRNERALERIRRYVVSNPAMWETDDENPARIEDR